MLRHVTLVMILVLFAACSSDSTGPEAVSIAGTYDYAYSTSNSQYQVSCNGQGEITVSQTGSQFTGSGAGSVFCEGPGGQFSDQGSVSVSGGQIDGNTLSFRFLLYVASCDADGTMSGDPVNQLQGSMSCTFDSGGETIDLTGSWSASR